MTQAISSQLSCKIEALAILLIGLDKGRGSAVELFREIVADGQNEGLSKDQVKALLKEACERRGLSDRTYYLYLPKELKNPVFVESGKRSRQEKPANVAGSEPTIEELKCENAELREQLRQKDIKIAELEEVLAQFSGPKIIA